MGMRHTSINTLLQVVGWAIDPNGHANGNSSNKKGRSDSSNVQVGCYQSLIPSQPGIPHPECHLTLYMHTRTNRGERERGGGNMRVTFHLVRI